MFRWRCDAVNTTMALADVGNYIVTTTPRVEHAFAFLEPDHPDLPDVSFGVDPHTGADLGSRRARKREVDWRRMVDPVVLCMLINSALRSCGIGYCRATHPVVILHHVTVLLA